MTAGSRARLDFRRARVGAGQATVIRLVDRTVTVAAAVTGLLLAAVSVVAAPTQLLWSIALGAVAGAAVHIRNIEPGTRRSSAPVHPGAGVLAGVATVALCAVVTGLVLVLGTASGVVILSLVLVSAPWVWRRMRRVVGRTPARAERLDARRAEPDRPVLVPVLAVEALSTSELCLAWRRSYLVLIESPPGQAHDAVVGLRRDLLDELQRRDHAGFGRWIDTGARAASDPGRYLNPDR